MSPSPWPHRPPHQGLETGAAAGMPWMGPRRPRHEWIEVGARRWCLACGSFQVRRGGRWSDAMVGPWPGYNRTDPSKHAFVPTPKPDAPPQVAPPRYICRHCGAQASDPRNLCEPVPVS